MRLNVLLAHPPPTPNPGSTPGSSKNGGSRSGSIHYVIYQTNQSLKNCIIRSFLFWFNIHREGTVVHFGVKFLLSRSLLATIVYNNHYETIIWKPSQQKVAGNDVDYCVKITYFYFWNVEFVFK